MKTILLLETVDRLPNKGELYVNEEGEYYIGGDREFNDKEGWPGEKSQTVNVSLRVTDMNFLASIISPYFKHLLSAYPIV